MTPKKKKTQKRYETKKSDHPSEERYLMCLDFDFDNCLCIRKVTQIYSVIISVFYLNSIEVISIACFLKT